MDETLPHFAMGKSANLLSVAASLRERSVGMIEAQELRRPQATATGACPAHEPGIKPFDISQGAGLI
jgi:hypothetical protein